MANQPTDEDTSSHEWHRAMLGVFLCDENDNIYALTCKHVTQFPSDGNVYIKTGTENMKPFGKLLRYPLSEEGNRLNDFCFDIDIIGVDKSFDKFCYNWKEQLISAYKDITVFNDNAENLYDSKISSLCNGSVAFERDTGRDSIQIHAQYFPCKDNRGLLEDIRPRNDSSHPGCIVGYIQPKERHHSERQGLTPSSFLLRTLQLQFDKGDSGTVIARENDGMLELVGILTGQYESDITKEIYIVCISLGAGIASLEETYRKKLTLYRNFQSSGHDDTGAPNICLLSGSVLWIKSPTAWVKDPEDIKEIDYDFVEVVICLIDAMKDDEISAEDLRQEEINEKILSDCVRARENLETREHICNSPAVTCYYFCMKGCNYLYSGEYTKVCGRIKVSNKTDNKTSLQKPHVVSADNICDLDSFEIR